MCKTTQGPGTDPLLSEPDGPQVRSSKWPVSQAVGTLAPSVGAGPAQAPDFPQEVFLSFSISLKALVPTEDRSVTPRSWAYIGLL